MVGPMRGQGGTRQTEQPETPELDSFYLQALCVVALYV